MLKQFSSQQFQFGTDGIRGQYGVFPITDEAIYHLTYALIEWLEKEHNKTSVTLMVARDTRESSSAIHHAIVAAAVSKGAKVLCLGVCPTPALAWLVQQQIQPVDAAFMITASHNPWRDNGVKLFNHQGRKFSPQQELDLSTFINRCLSPSTIAPLKDVGTHTTNITSLLKTYQQHVHHVYQSYAAQSSAHTPWHIVVDSANGALCELAYSTLEPLGYRITAIANQPNGKNINEQCGATCPETLAQIVLDEKADLGVCFDGDGDRIILSDSKGRVIDGDGILYFLAPLFGNADMGIVGTQMTNGFVEKHLRQLNIAFIRTAVGDKYIAEALEKNQWRLGGESSGHILLPEYNPCGDALLTLLVVLAILQSDGVEIKEAFTNFCPYPQKLVSLAVTDKSILAHKEVQEKLTELQQTHPETIILVRPSGTENVIRIMVESAEESLNNSLSNEIVELLQQRIKASA